MKKLITLFLLLVSISYAQAQNTVVSATIQTRSGQNYSNGTWKIDFYPTPGVPGPFTQQGQPFTQHFSGSLDANGFFTVTIASTSSIVPAKSQWSFTVCPDATFECTTTNQTVNGTTLDMSANINAYLPAALTDINPLPTFNSAYKDLQVGPPLRLTTGSAYFNSTVGQPCWWYHTSFICAFTTNNPPPPPTGVITQVLGSGITTVTTAGTVATVFTPQIDWNAASGPSSILNKPPITYNGTIISFGAPISVTSITSPNGTLSLGPNVSISGTLTTGGGATFGSDIHITGEMYAQSVHSTGVVEGATVMADNLASSGTNCVQASSTGVLSSTGSPCGTGGGGGGAAGYVYTNGGLVYNGPISTTSTLLTIPLPAVTANHGFKILINYSNSAPGTVNLGFAVSGTQIPGGFSMTTGDSGTYQFEWFNYNNATNQQIMMYYPAIDVGKNIIYGGSTAASGINMSAPFSLSIVLQGGTVPATYNITINAITIMAI